jgi:hypothetical protein
MPRNWEARDKKLDRRRHGMRVSNRSIIELANIAERRNSREQALFEAKRRKEKGRLE